MRLADKLYHGVSTTVVQQGEEPEEFWAILGSEPGSEIPNQELLTGPVLSPRLFHVTARRAWEIFNFKQAVTFYLIRRQLATSTHCEGSGW